MGDIHKIRTGIMRILGIVVICLFTMMTVIGTYQTVAGYFFNRLSTVSERPLTYSFIWMALLASAHIPGKRGHMRTGLLADKITNPVRKCLEIAIDLLTLAFTGVVMVYGDISITKLTTTQTMASLRVPMGYTYAIVPVTGLLITLFSLMDATGMMHRDFSEKEEV